MDMQTIVCEAKKALSRPKKHQFFQLRFYLPKFLENSPWLTLIKNLVGVIGNHKVQYIRDV